MLLCVHAPAPLRAGDSPPAAAAPNEWLTHYEQNECNATPRYAETIGYCRRLAEASPWVRVMPFGRSPQGREMFVVVLSRHGVFSPEAASQSDDAVVLIQNCIHAGECEGKDASLMLMREMAVTKSLAHLLDHATVLIIPIFNVDGHERFGPYNRINQIGPVEMGWRSTAQRLNLNRDYVKAETPEMRAKLALWNAWQPDLHIDNHSTDGADFQYDVMYAIAHQQETAAPVRRWIDELYLPVLLPAMARDGHVMMPYAWLIDRFDASKGLRHEPFEPRLSTGYGPLRNRPSLLVESHVRKPYRVRVQAHYDIMRHTLEIVGREAAALRAAVRQADSETAEWGRAYDPERRYPLRLELTDESEPYTFRGVQTRTEMSEISGALRLIYEPEPVEVATKLYASTRPAAEVAPPVAYLLPPEWAHLTTYLDAHGVRHERLKQPYEGEVESYRFGEVKWAGEPFEGHHLVTCRAEPIRERRTYPPGSVLVRLDQPGAKVALHLFEPDSRDSLVAWGLFDQVFDRIEYGETYILEDLARRMLAEDPALREEFESLLRRDREFRADPFRRLYFFYDRSPWADTLRNVYPVARITSSLPREVL